MKPKDPSGRACRLPPIMGGGLIALALLAPAGAAAAPGCTIGAFAALAGPNVTISAAFSDPSLGGICHVQGSVKTTGFGAPDGSANFDLLVPASWNGKFMFWGVGGFAGASLGDASPNGVDAQLTLLRGYAVAVTDEGHTGHGLTPSDGLGVVTDGRWALIAPGVADQAKVTDYYFRATHEVIVATKALVEAAFGKPIQRAYFDGCSNGGRGAFVEATKFPDDFDGIIAGAPFFDIRTILGGVKINKQQLSPQTYIPAGLLPAVDKAVYASCDAVDGVKDGLIQNPAKCSFDPDSLVGSLLTQGQADTLEVYFSALHDDDGHVIYTGAAITDLSGGGMDAWTTGFVPPSDFNANEPWGNIGFTPAPIAWQFVDHFIKFLVERDPNFNMRDYGVSKDGVVGDAALKLFDQRSEAGDGDVPETLLPFIKKGKKLIVYHGWSDPALTPTRTVKWYEDLAETIEAPFEEVQENVRLFMVPGMQHCGGGPGPNVFDTLTPLENWVEKGEGPDAIIATHFSGATVTRTMPLCKFPEQAQYKGSGDVNSAANWTCPSDDRSQLEVGRNGKQAGLRGPHEEHEEHEKD
jgi:feruloyl esterase